MRHACHIYGHCIHITGPLLKRVHSQASSRLVRLLSHWYRQSGHYIQVDEHDVPLTPLMIRDAEVLWNPFDDLQPRVDKEAKKAAREEAAALLKQRWETAANAIATLEQGIVANWQCIGFVVCTCLHFWARAMRMY